MLLKPTQNGMYNVFEVFGNISLQQTTHLQSSGQDE